MANVYIPLIINITPGQQNPGSTVSITVTLNGRPTDDQPVAICSSVQGFFTNLPTSVTVLAGNNSVTFTATLSTTATDSDTLAASCNGIFITAACMATGA